MYTITRIVGNKMNTDRIRTGCKAASLLVAGMALSAAGIAYPAAFSGDERDVQAARTARDKETLDPVTRALKAAVRNGSMSEQNARQTYWLLTEGRPASGEKARRGSELEQAAAKLDAMVQAGKLSAEDAEAKMNAWEEKRAFEEQLVSKIENEGKSKAEAYLELVEAKLDASVRAGELSVDDAAAKMNAVEQEIAAKEERGSRMELEGKSKVEAYLEEAAAKLDEAVEAGKLSAQDADAKMDALEKRIAFKEEMAARMEIDGEFNAEAYLELVAERLDALVETGELSADDAEARLISLQNSIAVRSKAGSLDARTVLRAAKRVNLDRDQKDKIRDIERQVQRVYRKIPRKDKQAHTVLAEQVKAQITKLMDAEQNDQFEAALQRLDRGSRPGARKQRGR